MENAAEVLREQLAAIAEAQAMLARASESVLACAGGLERSDREACGLLLEAADAFGHAEQAEHGRLLLLLAQVDRLKAVRGGIKAWVATHLSVTDGRARAIAQQARRIGAIPELAAPLASGAVGADVASVLAHTAKAVSGTGMDTVTAVTDVLETVQASGVGAARRQAHVLEEALKPGTAEDLIARQRARSYYRVTELDNGLTRFEVLLDAVRATTLRAAIELQSSDWIRRAQYDHERPLPEDVCTVEQINVQALVRLAEVFLSASAHTRQARFTPPVLYVAAQHQPDGLVETVHGMLVPVTAVSNPQEHVLGVDETGNPVTLDGKPVDADRHARLASPAQRTALEYRDRHCTFPGCSRPPTFSLHAHHRREFSRGGPTTIANLTLLCSEHHVLTHQQEDRDHSRGKYLH